MDEATIAEVVVGSGLTALVSAHVALRHRRQKRDQVAYARNVEAGLHLPASLHPVIDPDICIGSLSCLKACPEGDILGIVDGAARLVHANHCIGHGRCAAACPVHAIQLVLGTATRGVDLPEVDSHFESSRPGVHVIGELAGMGLIRNAVEQAAQCATYIADSLARQPSRGGEVADAVVIGSGPAGVGCALGLRARGLWVRLVDRSKLGGSLAHYPRHGLVMNGSLQLPGSGKLRQQRVSKQELLAYLEKSLATVGQRVEEGVVVTGLGGQDGAFVLETSTGTIAARKVVLATGRRGAPRKLAVPGEDLPKVTYSLVDPEQYAGARVIVVGGGDVAVEAACSLAEVGCAAVALSYRGRELTRCRPANALRAVELAGKGRLELLFSSEVKEIEERSLTLQRESQLLVIANDYVIVCIGGELPLEFLQKLGVRVKRHFGEEASAASAPKRQSWTLTAEQAERRRWHRRMAVACGALLLFLAALGLLGSSYYLLRGSQRLQSPLHPWLKPASSLGLTIGIAASALMLTNFLYALRKRWARMAGLGNLSTWLDVHVVVGILSPLVIAFHAAFQSNNLAASTTYVSLGVVVATGLVGRYLYSLIPGSKGMPDLLARVERGKLALEPVVEDPATPAMVRSLYDRASSPSPRSPFAIQLARSAIEKSTFRLRLMIVLWLLVPPERRHPLREGLLELMRLRSEIGLFGAIHRLMRAWRGLHVSLAVLLVVTLLAHIALSVYLGYVPGLR
ncbi:MAG TPA: NAD(P)-binding domain-containing protein [Anaeromyxobacteraceae bacterium]|nr:NAD(P)-binding domain-containing protein [Anaeromyxobacteraceae bacterium]